MNINIFGFYIQQCKLEMQQFILKLKLQLASYEIKTSYSSSDLFRVSSFLLFFCFCLFFFFFNLNVIFPSQFLMIRVINKQDTINRKIRLAPRAFIDSLGENVNLYM